MDLDHSTVATDILAPVWKVTKGWKRSDPDNEKVFFIVIAVAFVTGFLLIVRKALFRKRR